MCNCMDEVDKLLHRYDTQIKRAYNLFDKSMPPSMAVVATEKITGSTKRGKPQTFVATFCPICGKKYEGDK